MRDKCVFSLKTEVSEVSPRADNGLIKSDGFSHLFNFTSPAFAEQAFPLFAVRNAGFLSYGQIP
jgi:hypothetical protein